MRKGFLSLILFLLATILSAQNIMKVWSNDTLIEFDISTIDSITFEVKTEYVGVLLLGSKFNPVWIGNRIEKNFLYKHKKTSFWQTPTITPVAMSALAATCWMIKNKDRGGIYFPDDINEYKEIVKFAEKYISKTIYKTFSKRKIEQELSINIDNLQFKDIIT